MHHIYFWLQCWQCLLLMPEGFPKLCQIWRRLCLHSCCGICPCHLRACTCPSACPRASPQGATPSASVQAGLQQLHHNRQCPVPSSPLHNPRGHPNPRHNMQDCLPRPPASGGCTSPIKLCYSIRCCHRRQVISCQLLGQAPDWQGPACAGHLHSHPCSSAKARVQTGVCNAYAVSSLSPSA